MNKNRKKKNQKKMIKRFVLNYKNIILKIIVIGYLIYFLFIAKTIFQYKLDL